MNDPYILLSDAYAALGTSVEFQVYQKTYGYEGGSYDPYSETPQEKVFISAQWVDISRKDTFWMMEKARANGDVRVMNLRLKEVNSKIEDLEISLAALVEEFKNSECERTDLKKVLLDAYRELEKP